jgi:hypothetical protein
MLCGHEPSFSVQHSRFEPMIDGALAIRLAGPLATGLFARLG